MTETLAPFAHPETGEALETQADFRRALDEINARMAPLWRVQRAIREANAERFEYAVPHRRRDRTDKQERVHRCPRCGQVEEA